MRKLAVILLFIMPIYSWAAQTDTRDNVTNRSKNLVDHRFRLEKRDFSNPFVVSFYKPTYVLPFYYHFASPSLPDHNAVPNQQKLQNTDPECAAAIDDLRAEAQMVRVLGSYSRAADD